MASRFWVAGGDGNWSSTTNWSATSGGASGASVPGAADTATFNASSGAGTATVDSNVEIQTLTMTGFTGTLAFGTSTITLNSTGTIFTGATTYTVTGTPIIICNNSSATARIVAPGAVTEANSITFKVTAGTGNFTFNGTNNATRDNDFTGFTGALVNVQRVIYGSLTLYSGMSLSGSGNQVTLGATSGSKTLTSVGLSFDFPLVMNMPGATLTLQDALTLASTRSFGFTAGSLDLGGNTLTAGIFSSNNSNTRSIAFGTANITLTGNGITIFDTRTTTGMTYTGTPTVNCTYAGSTGTRAFLASSTAGGTETNTFDINITAGTDIVSVGARMRSLNLTGFAGSMTSAIAAIYGNYTVPAGVTINASATATTFAATSGAQTITTNNVTHDVPFTVNAPGATVTLAGNLTLGSTRALTLTAGTLNLSGNTATPGSFSSTGSTTRVLAFGTNGVLSPGGAFTASGSNLTTTGTGTINMTSASPKTFAGGGFSYVATLNQAGAGALTVSGSNTLYDITATTLPSTITFTAGTTQTVTQFTGSGTSGNLLTLNSSSAGSAFTLSDASGTNNVSYCSITDSTATGGATWNSYTTNGNVDGGGNTGWVFSAPVTYSYSSDIKLRSMAQRGRF